jgi:20S proteasome alpha/beta subunit
MNIKIAQKWGMMFAAEDATAFTPVIDETMRILKDLEPDPTEPYAKRDFSLAALMGAAQQAYQKEFSERFFRENLARFGFADIAEFRRSGYAEMGKDLYHQYSMELAKLDLGLELLIYGFDDNGQKAIFEVANPGKIINHSLRRYAVIGSGSLMALAALNKKRLGPTLPDTIYRLLDAKFSSETARDVGKKTHVISLGNSGKNGFLGDEEVQEIQKIWNKDLARPHPSRAINVIQQSHLVNAISSKRSTKKTKKKTVVS